MDIYTLIFLYYSTFSGVDQIAAFIRLLLLLKKIGLFDKIKKNMQSNVEKITIIEISGIESGCLGDFEIIS